MNSHRHLLSRNLEPRFSDEQQSVLRLCAPKACTCARICLHILFDRGASYLRIQRSPALRAGPGRRPFPLRQGLLPSPTPASLHGLERLL